MSTRATYLFKANDWQPKVCLYIHHDGYPDGAAFYFLTALLLKQEGNGGLADRFHRANDRAEFTKSHEYHGDTEWRYTVAFPASKEPTLIVHKRGSNWRDPKDWQTSYNGTLREFINANPGMIGTDEARDHLPVVAYGSRLLTSTQAAILCPPA